MAEKIAANPSGILMYHAPGRPFTLGKLLGVEFATELVEAVLVVFLLAHCTFFRPGRFRRCCRNPGGHHDEHFLLELVRIPLCLHDQLHAHPVRRFFSCGHCCCAHLAKARFPLTRLAKVSHEVPARSVPAGHSRFRTLLQLCHRYV